MQKDKLEYSRLFALRLQ